jgi:hypothetical protein
MRKPRRRSRLSPTVQFFSTPRGAQVLASMLRRVGETAEKRLRWVVEFTRRDLGDLTPGEVEALGDDLRMAAVRSQPRGMGLNTKLSPMPPGVLRRYQVGIDEGLRALLGKDCQWLLSGRAVLQQRANGFRIAIDGDEKAGILGGIAQLVVEAGERLRACQDPQCGRPFVATKRQVYCITKHSMRVRNAKRIEKERSEAMKGEPHG